MVSEPAVVQFTPSGDFAAVNLLPTRVSLRKEGAAPLPPDVCVESPAGAVRRWNARPLPALTSMKAWRAFGASDSRIITPAFVQTCAWSVDITCVTTDPSPVSDV